MKLVCVGCDEQMSLEENRGPDEGSLTMRFACPKCGNRTNILTNPMETQMVRSLGVEVCPAGAQGTPEPMGFVKGTLASKRPGALDAKDADEEEGISWTADAEERIGRVPSFIRAMVKKSIVKFARGKGYREINGQVMDEAKSKIM